MINYLIHANICIVVFYLLYIILLRKESFYSLNRIYILFSILLSLVIPVVAPYFYEVLDTGTYAIILPEVTISASGSDTLDIKESHAGFNWIHLTYIIYFTGLLISLSAVILALGKLISFIYRGEKTRMENYTLVKTEAEISIFSFFNFIVVPVSLRVVHPHIIRHELVHIRKYHTLDVVFLELMRAFCWFNPLIYAFVREIKAVHEYEADRAFKNREEVNSYVQLLLDGLENRLISSGLCNYFHNSLIKKRIDMLHKKESSMTHRWKYLMLIPAAMFLISAVQSRDVNPLEASINPEFSLMVDTIPPKSSDRKDMEIFKIVEEMPRFPGCEDQDLSKEAKENCGKTRMLEYIYTNLKYPASAKESGVEGTVIVQFIIDKTGSLRDIKVIRDVGAGCGDEVVRVLQKMIDEGIQWVPGKQGGENVNVLYTLPVKFKIDEKD